MSCGKYKVELSYPNGARSVVEETASDSQAAADKAILENPAANLAKAEPGNGEASGFTASLRSADYDERVRRELESGTDVDALWLAMAARWL